MKNLIFGTFFSLVIAGTAFASTSSLSNLTCRSYDYYELAGNRKVVEVSITRTPDGTYAVKLFHIFETLLPNLQYKEKTRDVELEFSGLSCAQADPSADPKIVSCSSQGIGSYFGLSRVDNHTIGSPFSSQPGVVFNTSHYEGMMFGNGGDFEGLKDGMNFDLADCALN